MRDLAVATRTATGTLNSFVSLGVDAAVYNTDNAIVDSGSTAFMLPSVAFAALTARLYGEQAFVDAFGKTFFTDGKCISPMNGEQQQQQQQQ